MIPIHSPAPWSIEFDRINDATGKQVAQITPRLTGEQNHRLIAAAPELLDALSDIFGHAERTDAADLAELWGRMDDIRDLASAAIAKAKGGAR